MTPKSFDEAISAATYETANEAVTLCEVHGYPTNDERVAIIATDIFTAGATLGRQLTLEESAVKLQRTVCAAESALTEMSAWLGIPDKKREKHISELMGNVRYCAEHDLRHMDESQTAQDQAENIAELEPELDNKHGAMTLEIHRLMKLNDALREKSQVTYNEMFELNLKLQAKLTAVEADVTELIEVNKAGIKYCKTIEAEIERLKVRNCSVELKCDGIFECCKPDLEQELLDVKEELKDFKEGFDAAWTSNKNVCVKLTLANRRIKALRDKFEQIKRISCETLTCQAAEEALAADDAMAKETPDEK